MSPRSPTAEHVIIGANIALLRTNRGESQKDLAAHLGVSLQQVQKYEAGKHRLLLCAVRFRQVCEFYDVPMKAMFSPIMVSVKTSPAIPKFAPERKMKMQTPNKSTLNAALQPRNYDGWAVETDGDHIPDVGKKVLEDDRAAETIEAIKEIARSIRRGDFIQSKTEILAPLLAARCEIERLSASLSQSREMITALEADVESLLDYPIPTSLGATSIREIKRVSQMTKALKGGAS